MANSTQADTDRAVGIILAGAGVTFIVMAALIVVSVSKDISHLASAGAIQADSGPLQQGAGNARAPMIMPLMMWTMLLLFLVALLGMATILIHRWGQRLRTRSRKHTIAQKPYQDAWTVSGQRYENPQ